MHGFITPWMDFSTAIMMAGRGVIGLRMYQRCNFAGALISSFANLIEIQLYVLEGLSLRSLLLLLLSYMYVTYRIYYEHYCERDG